MRTERTLVDLLRQQAGRYHDKVAMSFSWNGDDEDRSQLTYRQLDIKARAIAASLQQRGAAGQRALVIYRPGLDFIAGYFGCLYAGAVAVPVHPQIGARLSVVVPDARPRFALATAQTQAHIRADVDRLVDGQALQWYTIDEVGADAEDWVSPGVDADTPATIQYTSGTTRLPRGIVSTHRNLLHNVAAAYPVHCTGDWGIDLSWQPQHHNMGLYYAVASIYGGRTLVVMAPAAFVERPMRWLEAMSRHRATATSALNFAFDLCVERSTPDERAALDLSSLVSTSIAGDQVRTATLRAFTEAFAAAGFQPESFNTVYGLSEAGTVTTGSDSPLPVVRHIDRTALGEGRVVDVAPEENLRTVELVSCGRPVGGQQVVIVDPETRRPCGADEAGEIWVRGPGVAPGYWGRPEETEQTFSAFLAETEEGPFLRSGDRGFLRSGELFVAGRYQDLIVINGRNYYPTDIEATVQDCHPALASGRGAVFACEPRPDPAEQPTLMHSRALAFVDAPESGAAEQLIVVQEVDLPRVGGADPADLIAASRTAVTQHHGIGAHAVILVTPESIPTTAGGKIQRSQCRSQFLDGSLKVVADWRESSSLDASAAMSGN